jgi:hypothetical protein
MHSIESLCQAFFHTFGFSQEVEVFSGKSISWRGVMGGSVLGGSGRAFYDNQHPSQEDALCQCFAGIEITY